MGNGQQSAFSVLMWSRCSVFSKLTFEEPGITWVGRPIRHTRKWYNSVSVTCSEKCWCL